MAHIVVVGAGQAGQAAVTKLRDLGFEGEITLLGEESVPPYQRPPLSKKYLIGEMELERMFLRPEKFYADQNINLEMSAAVQSIDPAGKTIQMDGRLLAYDHLILTTGSRPHRLPAKIGGELPGVFTMRTLADADALAPKFIAGRNVLVVGGGYIGLEAAAVAAQKGMNVTLVEMADRILQRVAAKETSDWVRQAHRKQGVDIREGVGLTALTGKDRVTGATLTDGTKLPVDLVIVGIGIAPNTDLAEAAGLTIENGIRTDERGRTSDPFIWAAGDCASFPYKDGRIRLESVGNAIDQAELVARNIMGADEPYDAHPWFWSDQYDMKLQIAGLNMGYDSVTVRPGETAESVSHWYYHADTLVAVDAINDSRAYMVGKRLIESGKSPTPDTVSNPETDLKSLLRSA